MHPYPFSALVGASDLQLALLLNAVNPAIGGVLVRGEKGTAKSTAVRGLAALLPDVTVVAGCRFSCDPARPDPACPDGPHAGADDGAEPRSVRLVELPVGATEDRLAGSIDLERALMEGRRAFEPGLLAEAHRGVLYVDEVNLLGDHLVDLLLDAAAMGTNIVEREGVSVRHPARFQLVGTMNPEEGELRPQLLDRFGLTVEIAASRDPAERAEVVRRRLDYEADPAGFAAAWTDTDAQTAARVRAARKLLGEVVLGDEALDAVVAACAAFEVDGMRADIVTAKTASTLAAWEQRSTVTVDDVRTAALLALPHRRRRGPFDPPGIDEQRLDEALGARDGDGEGPDDDPPPGGAAPPPTDQDPTDQSSDGNEPSAAHPSAGAGETAQPAGSTFRPVLLETEGVGAGAHGRRSPAEGDRGRHAGARRPAGRPRDVDLPATLRAAAPYQTSRGRPPPGQTSRGRPPPGQTSRGRPTPGQGAGERGAAGLVLRRGDLRQKTREGREGNLVLFTVDASGSMAARRRMSAVKGAVLSLLLDAYQRRDRIGVITFRGDRADLLVPPTSSVDLAARLLTDLPTGGRTPIAAGLQRAAQVIASERVRDPRRRPLLLLLTDGRVTTGPDPAAAAAGLASRGVPAVVVNTEDGPLRLGLSGRLATALGAPCLRLEELAAGPLAGLVHSITAGPRRGAA
ncbi:MAG: magnesium chelatase subunit D family protein [Egibacteraceae bacterium]